MKNYFIFLALILFCIGAYAPPASPTPAEFRALMKLDYISFDQTLPNGGWRGIQDSFEAAKVLDAYNLQNSDVMSESEVRVIFWHAGQSYAMADITEVAIARFQSAYNPKESSADTFKWNAYVRGSIAFLKRDRKTLQAARDEMYAADPSDENRNRVVLDAFLRCFNKTYREAYSADCRQ